MVSVGHRPGKGFFGGPQIRCDGSRAGILAGDDDFRRTHREGQGGRYYQDRYRFAQGLLH
jgi:hypothetical protein